jgi:hypothetical protein
LHLEAEYENLGKVVAFFWSGIFKLIDDENTEILSQAVWVFQCPSGSKSWRGNSLHPIY